ncbi:hypothetical protein [Hyphomicrobium sp.]|uniref:hypothetical protein n=1 Tax=Hyphomicrobium sp. TaxID=82 RepID=UPI003F6FAD09
MGLATCGRILGVCALICWSARADAAGGAYVVDDAAIGMPGECQVETWTSHGDNGHLVAVLAPACVVDLGAPVEFTTTLLGSRVNSEWTGTAGLQAKVILVPVGPATAGIALVAGTVVDFDGGQIASAFVNVPVTIQVHDHLRVNLNGGWLDDRLEDKSHITWGAGFEWDLAKKWTLIGEVYGLVGSPGHEPRMQAGLRYMPSGAVDCDLIYGNNIAGENANWITAGVTFRY